MSRPALPSLTAFSVIGACFLAPVLWTVYWPTGGVYDVVGYHLGRDFINMWSGPRIAANHGVAMLFDLTGYHWAQSELAGRLIHFHNWSYPPYILFLAWPFSLLPYVPSLILWTTLGFAAYCASVLPQIAPERRAHALLFLLIAPSTLVNTISGQNGFFTAALFVGGIALMQTRPWLAGVLFGLLTIKPHLGILIAVALAVTLGWRTILAAGFTAALMVGASWLAHGSEAWSVWLTETSAYQYRLLADFRGFHTYMMTSVYASARILGASADVAQLIQGAISVSVLATTACMVRKTADPALRTLLLSSGTLLALPYVFNYDMTALTAALLWVMFARGPHSTACTIALGAAWAAPSAVWLLHGAGLGLSPIACGSVFVASVAMIAKERRAASMPPPASATDGLALQA